LDLKNNRAKFVRYIKSQLIGTDIKDSVLTGQKPLDRFFTGFLFPIIESGYSLDSIEDNDEKADIMEEEEKTEVKLINKEKRYIPPSSAGFSFFITGDDIKLRIFYNAVHYKKVSSERDEHRQKFIRQEWRKEKLAEDGREIEFTPKGPKQYKIFDKKAKIDALWRKYKTGYIVTITMSNHQVITDIEDRKRFNLEQNERTLFEVDFRCIVESGNIDVYPSKNEALLTDEEKEIELRYKDVHIFAVGHGTAVNWSKNDQQKMEIWTDFIPIVEVPQVTANVGGKIGKTLEFSFLKECEKKEDVIEKLGNFINDYEGWIKNQNHKAKKEDEKDKNTAKNIVRNLAIAKTRMQEGLEFLRTNHNARIAFAKMNEAMLMQWMSNDKNSGVIQDKSHYKWRPFQLAFILMVLESATNENSNFRDTLDLIWFPTGGGKTEAYLGLMGFLFIYRRLEYPASSGGTISIMRYTLRLLTSQQFVRANRLILALELIRQRSEDRFGTEPFSTGLWVGIASSPNTFIQAKKIIDDEEFSKLILTSCPWCNAKFKKGNYIVKDDQFNFTCSNPLCEFGKNKNNILPCNIVDEALYENPPSLLIATVDKFARLAWEERASSFFGKNGNKPPELIIQDELHLISSALGSIVGLYEVAVDTVLISRGMNVKYIASTATIKNAKKQIQALFAREMTIFPPPGIRHDDSYFAKTVPLDEKPGRLYVGYLAPLLNRQRSLEPLAGALLSAPAKLFKDNEEYMDKWWTQVIYHGSLKGVGNSRTLYQSGVLSYLNKMTIQNLINDIEEDFPHFTQDNSLKTIDDFEKIEDLEVKAIVKKYLPTRTLNIKTLTSNQSAEENAKIFEALSKEKDQIDSIDVALATNMISVGLDVSRLALMVINGQPLTTAEYIQASSRVGRSETPGIVFINYYKTQARSLSHYENFRSYHDSFYRFVEPSSLTPFTYQARSRALHAALVIAVRHSDIGLLKNDSANEFDKENESLKEIVRNMKNRCSYAVGNNNETKDKVNKHINKLVDSWQQEADYSLKNKEKLVYNSNDNNFNNLICNFDEKKGLWQTLQSMRNVENSALMKLITGIK
jgi:hypothetical protein